MAFAAVVLVGCGGGGGGGSKSFTVENTATGTTHSCPAEAAFNACSTGDCGQCTCTVGCDANAPLVTLAVTMAPGSLEVGQDGDLTLKVNNPASVSQVVEFELNMPAGTLTSFGIGFNGVCGNLSFTTGASGIKARTIVPSGATCEYRAGKRFVAAAAPVGFTLTGLTRIALQGSLPSVTVTAIE